MKYFININKTANTNYVKNIIKVHIFLHSTTRDTLTQFLYKLLNIVEILHFYIHISNSRESSSIAKLV